MKKFLFTIAALAIVAAGCSQKEEDGPGKGKNAEPKLTSFQILAADNEGLEEDYAPDAIAPSMVVRVPGGGAGKTFVATLSAGEDDVIKLNDEEVVDGKASFDATYAVDIVVTNSKSNKSAQYEVKIGKILQLLGKKLGSFVSAAGDLTYTSSSFKAAVNPVTGEMYLAYTFTPTGGVKNIGVVKYSGGSFVQVGTEGIVPAPAEGSAIATSNVCSLQFDESGTPYLLYLAGDVKNSLSVRKFDGSAWTLVGKGGFSDKPTTTFCTPELYFDASGNPGVIYADPTRGAAIYSYSSSEWTKGSISGFPAFGVDNGRGGSYPGMFYGGRVLKSGGKIYGLFSANWYGLYIYELSGSAWSTAVISDYIAEGENTMIPGNLKMFETKDGKILVFAAHWSKNEMQLYQFSGTDLKPYGDPYPITISDGGSTIDANVCVNPVTGQIMLVRVADSSNEAQIMYSFLDENLKWEDTMYLGNATTTTPEPTDEDPEPQPVTTYDIPGAYGATFGFGFSKEGAPLIIYPDQNRKANGFHLYTVGLEDDVLPE